MTKNERYIESITEQIEIAERLGNESLRRSASVMSWAVDTLEGLLVLKPLVTPGEKRRNKLGLELVMRILK